MKRLESVQNSLVKHWKKLVTTRKERDSFNEFLIEGFHLTEEALKEKDLVLSLIVREGVDIPSEWDVSDVQLYDVSAAVAKEISETEHSQGIFAHCRQPKFTAEDEKSWKKLLLIDAVQDPGNIGTMIRTAAAAGIDAVVLGKGCADPFNPKTVRSAQGSHFHLPVVKGQIADWIETAQAQNIPVYGTALENATPFYEVSAAAEFALIVGNEGSGVNPEFLKDTDKNLLVPIYGSAESLNVAVATGILLYSLVAKN